MWCVDCLHYFASSGPRPGPNFQPRVSRFAARQWTASAPGDHRRPEFLSAVCEHERVTDAHADTAFRQLHDLVSVLALDGVPGERGKALRLLGAHEAQQLDGPCQQIALSGNVLRHRLTPHAGALLRTVSRRK